MAALRHFDAIEVELEGLLKDPDLGRCDMKSAIIDGATRLVSRGIMPAATAVTQLSNVPPRPFDQKQWLMQQYMQAVQGQANILDAHRMAFAGTPATQDHGDPDRHVDVMSSLLQHYKERGHG